MTINMKIDLLGNQIGQIEGIPYSQDMSVQSAMEAAHNVGTDHAYNFSLEYFGTNLGYEVVTLDSVSIQNGSDPNVFLFWALYVNEHLSNTGIDETILNDGDLIGWNYEAYNPDLHSGTRVQRIRDAARTRGRGPQLAHE